MAELDDLSITDASNTARFPENMQFRDVNDSARALEGMLAREFKDRNMSLTASGSSNAFSVTTNRTITSLADSLLIGFTANHTITGSPTLNVNGLGAKTIVSQTGTALGSGDIVSGQKLQVAYRSATADFQVVGGRAAGSSADVLARVIPVGFVVPWPGSTAPSGFLLAYGQAVSRTTYAELYAVYGTTYGTGDGSTTFNLPDYRGRAPFGRDDMGGSAASRITTAGSSVDGVTLGAVGGAQNVTLTEAQMPQHNHTASVTDPTHAHTQTTSTVGFTGPATGGGTTAYAWSGAQLSGYAATGISVSIGNKGSSSAHTNMPPAIVQNWIILALPALASASTTGVNGLLYRFSNSTSGAPGDGKIGFDNATLASATGFRISETDATGAPMGPVLATWDDSTSTTKGALYVYKVGSLSTYAMFHVTGTMTDSGAYDSFTATYVSDNGTFTDGDQLSVIYVPRGDAGTGADGAAGADGGGLKWSFDSSTTTAADPGAGDVRFNNASLSSATELSISYQSDEVGNPDVNGFVKSWDDSTNTAHYGSLIVRKNGDPDTFCVFDVTSSITDGTTYGRFTIAYVSPTTPPTFTNGDVLSILFVRTGDKGANGAGAGDVTAASNFGTDNRLLRSDGTTKGAQGSAITADDSGNVSGVGTLGTSGVATIGTTAGTAVKIDPSGFVELPEISAPSTPASGFVRLYSKTDGKAYQKDDAGTETDLSQSGGGSSGSLEPTNVGLLVSASAGALTVALKGADGNDPSGSNIVSIPYRSATGTTGTITTRQVTAATSLTISSGSTMGVPSTTAFRGWLLAFDDAATIRLGLVNCLSQASSVATSILSLTDNGIASSTAEGGAGGADSAGVIYTGTAVTSKPYRILAYIEWNTSGITAGTWTTTNLSIVQPYHVGIPTPGQPTGRRATTNKTDTFTSTASVTWTDITNYSASITPTSAANAVRWQFASYVTVGTAGSAGAGNGAGLRMVRGSTAIGIGDADSARTQVTGLLNRSTDTNSASFIGNQSIDIPQSTSSTTYKVQFFMQGSETFFFNRSSATSDLTTIFRAMSNVQLEEIMT